MTDGIETPRGTIQISEEVAATIAALEAINMNGVAGMSGGIAGGIAELLGRKNLTKGIKADINGDKIKIGVFIIVYFGERIPDLSFKIQKKVKEAVENMTGLEVTEANVHVQGVISGTGENEADNEEV